jgi:chromosome segregation ATPase
MSKNSYILLSDYAKSAGISIDEARELLNREENKKFLKLVKGKEMVSTEIHKQQTPATESKVEEAPAPAPKVEEVEATPATPSADQEEIERLRKEVEELKAQVKSKDNQIAEYTLRFAELAQQAQLIAGQAQILQAKEQKLLDSPADNPERKKGFFSKLFGR